MESLSLQFRTCNERMLAKAELECLILWIVSVEFGNLNSSISMLKLGTSFSIDEFCIWVSQELIQISVSRPLTLHLTNQDFRFSGIRLCRPFKGSFILRDFVLSIVTLPVHHLFFSLNCFSYIFRSKITLISRVRSGTPPECFKLSSASV